MKEELGPYIISDDVHGLMEKWTSKQGLSFPRNGLFKSLQKEMISSMRTYFPGGVDVVDELGIKEGMSDFVRKSTIPVMSLDRAYITDQCANVEGFIDLTRGVNEELEDIGIKPRPGMPSKEDQLRKFYTPTVEPITLVDDVIFNGDSVVDLSRDLEKVNRPVKKVIAGIGIEKGIKLIENNGIEVESVYTYRNVMDEVCMRDFFPGVPLSGRSVYSSEGKIWSAPYIHPFGAPERWASIPEEYSKEFSQLCIEQAVTIWSAIEKASNTRIPNKKVPRRLKNMQAEQSIVDMLNNLKQ